jgi:hypothetical protein
MSRSLVAICLSASTWAQTHHFRNEDTNQMQSRVPVRHLVGLVFVMSLIQELQSSTLCSRLPVTLSSE